MFVLVEMRDVVQIEPWNFARDMKDCLEFGLNKKFANKVVHQVGLCIVLFDITEISDSYILPGDGSSHTPVKFRFVVFRPFIDEVLIGKVKSCSRDGVHVSMGFFDDILVPAEYLQQQSVFNETEQLWIWKYETEDGTHDLFVDINEEIRFRVIDEEFNDLTPSGPKKAAAPPVMLGAKVAEVVQQPTVSTENIGQDPTAKTTPYSVTASISESGLGLLTWWN